MEDWSKENYERCIGTKDKYVPSWEYLSATLSRMDRTTTKSEPLPPPLTWTEMREKTEAAPMKTILFSWKPQIFEKAKNGPRNAWRNHSQTPGVLLMKKALLLSQHIRTITQCRPEAKKLKLLWWKGSKEQWTPLKEGSWLNSLRTPKAIIYQNVAIFMVFQ